MPKVSDFVLLRMPGMEPADEATANAAKVWYEDGSVAFVEYPQGFVDGKPPEEFPEGDDEEGDE